jgi:hypothetical protein
MPRKPHFVLAPREGGALSSPAAAAAQKARGIVTEWPRRRFPLRDLRRLGDTRENEWKRPYVRGQHRPRWKT